MQIFNRTWPQLKDFEHGFQFHYLKFFFAKKCFTQNEVRIKSIFWFFTDPSGKKNHRKLLLSENGVI